MTMTTLPATVLEAEAVDYARRCIAYVRDGKLKLWGIVPGAWFEKGESQRACRAMLCDWAMRDAEHLMDAVGFARAGYELWEDALRLLILDYQNRGAKMPTYLEAFAMELTRGLRYARQPGRGRANDMLRDLAIGTIVAMVAERFNLRPRRNPASRRPSACSIVAAALVLEGMATSEDNVDHLWKTMPIQYKNKSWSQWLSA